MAILLPWCFLYLICKTYSSGFIEKASEPCTTSTHTDGFGNRGMLWQCGDRSLYKIPEHNPLVYKGEFITLDLSNNQFTRISNETFHNIDQLVRSRITSVSFQNNPIHHIGNVSFDSLCGLCELDLSNCLLQKASLEINSLSNLNQLKILQLHHNSFYDSGYPDIAISKARVLEDLTIDVFNGFYFSSYFQNLTKLTTIKFITGKSYFDLTNATFRGLIKSPIIKLEMKFKYRVYSNVSEDIFCSFPFLKEVHIEFGGMCDLNVALKSLKCLQNRTMDRIVAHDNNPLIAKSAVYIDNRNCKYLFNICSKRVELTRNRIVGIYYNLLNTIMGQCMEYFDISSNRIIFIDIWYMLDFLTRYPKLQVFNMSSNNYHRNCNHPQLEASRMIDSDAINRFSQNASNMFLSNILNETQLKKRGVVTFNISKKMKVLQLSKNYWRPLALPLPFDLSLKAHNLKELYLTDDNLPCKYVALINAPSLGILDISNNDCSEIKPNILRFALKLRIFLASNANIRFTGNLRHGTLFHGLMNLYLADLSRNSITYLPQAMFKDQENSMSTLNFASNLFSTIPISNLKNLTCLNLRHNRISFFTRNDIEKLLSMEKVIVFIEGNPISCECTHIWSLKWMKKNGNRFGDFNKTFCINRNELLSHFLGNKAFEKFELLCQSDAWLIGSSFSLVLVMIVLLTTAAIKRYRVHVDYVILRLRSRWKGVMRVANLDEFQFDAFLSYTEEEYQLVCNTFYKGLTRLGFKISLPDIDFLPGISEAEQLLQYIDQSRKVVFIVTESFLENGWNSYAVQMVVTHAFHNQRERSIIVIIKDDIPIERLPKDLRYIWWSIVSIRWPNGDDSIDSFWEEIAAVLRTNQQS